MDRFIGRAVTAEVIMCPGRVNPAAEFAALEIKVEGVETPYHFVLQMPVIGYKALAEADVDPIALYQQIADKINRPN